jgi:hypothetical protein
MNISRLSTFSLAMAIGVFALAFANPASAKGLKCDDGDPRPKCAFDPPADSLKYRVEMDGAFVMNQLTTSDGNELLGDSDFTINKPDLGDDALAAETWNDVWDVCNIYGPATFGPNAFTTTPDRKEKVQWVVTKSGGGVRVYFITSIQSHISPEPLGVVLILTSNCAYHADQLGDFPDDRTERTLCNRPFLSADPESPTTFDMQHFWNHADGKKGVAHAQPCHVGEGELDPSHSTLTITAIKQN